MAPDKQLRQTSPTQISLQQIPRPKLQLRRIRPAGLSPPHLALSPPRTPHLTLNPKPCKSIMPHRTTQRHQDQNLAQMARYERRMRPFICTAVFQGTVDE